MRTRLLLVILLALLLVWLLRSGQPGTVDLDPAAQRRVSQERRRDPSRADAAPGA